MINCNSQIIWSIENIKIILTLRLSFNIFSKMWKQFLILKLIKMKQNNF